MNKYQFVELEYFLDMSGVFKVMNFTPSNFATWLTKWQINIKKNSYEKYEPTSPAQPNPIYF